MPHRKSTVEVYLSSHMLFQENNGCNSHASHPNAYLISGMRIRIRSDPVIFGPPDPDPELFSTDPDPTCNNGFIKLFLS